MRVVTWNMGCGSRQSAYKRSHAEAWDYLVNELRPDVALLQEARLANVEAARATFSVRVCEVATGVEAGTAVLVRGREVTDAKAISVSASSYAATAEVKTDAGPLTVVSAHIWTGKSQYADLARLVELAAGSFATPVLVGGDFNACRRFDEVNRTTYKRFFEAMTAAGFDEPHWRIHGKEVQTFWGHQAKEAYQDDHFFVSKAWAEKVRECRVVDDAVVRRVSDHGPVVLELAE